MSVEAEALVVAERGEARAPADSSSRLIVTCALLIAAARFVPIPLVDEMLAARVRRYLIGRLLGLEGRKYPTTTVAPLYGETGGCLDACLTIAVKVPLAILLFPIRKIIAIATAVRDFAKDTSHTILLGRCVSRVLKRGLLVAEPAADAPQRLHATASIVRASFERTLEASDTSRLSAPIKQRLGDLGKLPGAAVRAARRLVKRKGETGDEASPTADLPGQQREELDRGTNAVQQALGPSGRGRVSRGLRPTFRR